MEEGVLYMINLTLSNPSTLRLSARKFAIIPEEGDNYDPLLIQQRDNRITVCMVDDNLSNIKEKFFFDINELNHILTDYSEDILFQIIHFLYEHSFIHENEFMEKILLLKYKYSLEFIITSLNSMDIQQLELIFGSDNTLKYFEAFI